jgi:hypothetical protein
MLTHCLLAGRPAALAYAKQHFSPFQHSRLKHIQRLMGCLLYYGREGQGAGASSGGSSRMETEGPGSSSPGCSSGSPYEDLLSDRQWEEVQQQFVKHACSLLGRVSGDWGSSSVWACRCDAWQANALVQEHLALLLQLSCRFEHM